jgi:GAF domain-containing protein
MPTPEARRARLGHLYELLAGTETVEEFAGGLARAAVDHMGGAGVSCGLTALMEARTVAIASSDELAADLDRIQDTAGEGPCVQAIATGKTVWVTDLATAPWPAWRDAALGYGLRQVLSLPLIGRTEPLGALNMYSTSTVPFNDEDRDAVHTFAIHATGALMVAVRLAQLAELTGHLETALESRGVIDQAKGVLMAENHCTADEAMAILRKASQNRNVKLRDLASLIVARVSGQDVSRRPVDDVLPEGAEAPLVELD